VKGNNRNWTTSTSSSKDGFYSVFIRAGNLHSDPLFGVNKMDQNATLSLAIQYPVQNWVLNAKPFWIATNGCKNPTCIFSVQSSELNTCFGKKISGRVERPKEYGIGCPEQYFFNIRKLKKEKKNVENCHL
jgi:hypothetical protein